MLAYAGSTLANHQKRTRVTVGCLETYKVALHGGLLARNRPTVFLSYKLGYFVSRPGW